MEIRVLEGEGVGEEKGVRGESVGDKGVRGGWCWRRKGC